MKKIFTITTIISLSFLIVFAILLQLSEENIKKSNRPVTKQEFYSLLMLDIQMPNSVKNIEYYFIDRGTQEHEIYLKYSIEKDELNRFLNIFNNEYQKKSNFPVGPLIKSSLNKVKRPNLSQIWWKDIKHIAGYYYGLRKNNEIGPQLWVDTVNFKIYYYEFF